MIGHVTSSECILDLWNQGVLRLGPEMSVHPVKGLAREALEASRFNYIMEILSRNCSSPISNVKMRQMVTFAA